MRWPILIAVSWRRLMRSRMARSETDRYAAISGAPSGSGVLVEVEVEVMVTMVSLCVTLETAQSAGSAQ